MGGSWEGDVNDCWKYCCVDETYMVDHLEYIVKQHNFDGVDIDYKYFTHTLEEQHFFNDVTSELQDLLPHGHLITHAPMEGDSTYNRTYYNILKANADIIDFIMP